MPLPAEHYMRLALDEKTLSVLTDLELPIIGVLARMELRIAYPALARRFPDLSAARPTDFRQKSIVYGLEALPVRLGAVTVPSGS